MWLPLAIADLYSAIIALIKLNASERSGIRVPERDAILRSWWLPFLASACEADKREADAIALYERVSALAKKSEQESKKG